MATCPWWARLSLADLPGGGPSFFCFRLFLMYVSIIIAHSPRGKQGPVPSVFDYAWPICLSFGSVLPMGWLSGSRSLSSRKEGHSCAVFVYFLRMCPSVGSQLAPRLALWLSLAELPGWVGWWAGGGPCLYSLMSDEFCLHLARGLPLGWLSGSCSLSSQREPFLLSFRHF